MVVVRFGCLLLWILWCLIQGGAFAQVGAHKQPLSPIVPPLFCNQPAGWDPAGAMGDKPGSKPHASPRKHCNSLQQSAQHLAAACKLPACMQAGLWPPPRSSPSPFLPPPCKAAAGPFPLRVLRPAPQHAGAWPVSSTRHRCIRGLRGWDGGRWVLAGPCCARHGG